MATPGRVFSFLMSVTAVAVAASNGCDYSVKKQPPMNLPPLGNYKPSELTFASVYRRVFRASCVGCHGKAGDVSVESYANTVARQNLQKIRDSVIERKMPRAPTPPLTDDQLGLLYAWISAGAPETAPDEEPGEVPIPLGPNFASIKYNVLEPKCVSCHAPGKSVARIPLVTLDDLLNSPLDLVLPGNPEESGLVLSVIGANPSKIMPPLKDENGKETGYSKLSDPEIESISTWIANGAKD